MDDHRPSHPNEPSQGHQGQDGEIQRPAPTMEDYIPRQSHASRTRKPTTMRTMWILVGVCVGVGILMYFSIDPLSGAVAKRVPIEWEKDFSASVLEKDLKDKGCNNVRATRILERLSQRITGRKNQPFKIFISRDENVNAFALPGGYMIFNRGFLNKAESVEEISGVMAHEMQHSIQRHVTKGLVRKAFFSVGALFAFGDVSGLLLYEKLGNAALSRSYERDDELSADKGAIKMLDRAKISRQGFIDFFARLKSESEASGKIPTIISTHPGHDQRIELIRDGMPQSGFMKVMTKRDWNYLNNVTCKRKI